MLWLLALQEQQAPARMVAGWLKDEYHADQAPWLNWQWRLYQWGTVVIQSTFRLH